MDSTSDESPEEVYSVWAIPPDPARGRLRRLMTGLRATHGGPAFEPHVTVVGVIRLRRSAAVEALRAAAAEVLPYTARVVGDRRGFYRSGCLLLEPNPEVMEASEHCCRHFGYERTSPYVPHVSLTYGDRTEEQEAVTMKEVEELDSDIRELQFGVSELALYNTDPHDVPSWKLVEVCQLRQRE